jgi:hypothetical protein
MTNPARLLNRLDRLMNRAGARFRKARPASVLILVIALLVLMALIGTAFITTARTDRYSATQNTYNTEVDLLIQGVLGLADGPMVRKIQGISGNFRQAASSTSTVGDSYFPYESPASDTYLASRSPSYVTNTYFPTSFPANTPGWVSITGPSNATSTQTTGEFEAPYAIDNTGAPVSGPVLYTARNFMIPTSISITQADGSVRVYPAFAGIAVSQVVGTYKTVAAAPVVYPLTVLAADADGDGIADSGFIRMPMGQLEGATYYGAVRIVDNLAAINASVAMEPFTTGVTSQTTAYSVGGDFFPTNINLRDMVAANGDNLATGGLNTYRFIAPSTPATGWSAAVDDYKVNHSDFVFNTQYEAAWTQLGSRLNNPGYQTTATKYKTVPIDEGMNLVYHGGLANINAPGPTAVLETYLPASVYKNGAFRAPFSPGDTTTWFNTLYNFNSPPTPLPLRSQLVVRNPVTSFTPSYFTSTQLGQSLSFGNYVQYPDPNTGNSRAFVCIQPQLSTSTVPPMSGTTYNNAYWAAMPWTNAPTKINANTGTFGQLWTAYWSVMQDSPDSSGAYPATNKTQLDFDSSSSTLNTLSHQFRSPVRNSSSYVSAKNLSRTQVIQLRSALAAVNTIDMRDGDNDITSRTIALSPASATGPAFYANVYGAEKQPYITEVLIDYEPTNAVPATPYVVIEIYNPHPTPIILTNWKLAFIKKGTTSLTLTEVGDMTKSLSGSTHPGPLSGAVIAPGERIVLENNQATRPTNLASAWTISKLSPITNKSTTTSNLDAAVGNELVLLRPRLGNGTLTTNAAPENIYSETLNGSTNLYDLVPLDNIDLIGVAYNSKPISPATTVAAQRYRYARATKMTADTGSAAWHCVFSGPYNPASAGGTTGAFHHLGLWPVVASGAGANNGNFGAAKAKFNGEPPPVNQLYINADQKYAPYATYDTRPLQINNRDSAGPNHPYNEALTGGVPNGNVTPVSSGSTPSKYPMSLPLGGFARNGDLLQVPFIGSYRISTQPAVGAAGNVLEMNSVTMDSVYAQYQATTNNYLVSATPTVTANSYDADLTAGPAFHNEQIGHFCPMTVGSTDFSDDPTDKNFATYEKTWTYHWAKRLFDYLDVRTPQDAYLPNVDPATSLGVSGDPSLYAISPASTNAAPTNNTKYPGTHLPAPISGNPSIVPIASYSNQQLQGRLDTASTEGLININTASAKVLSAVPWFTPGEDSNYLADNAAIAQAIVTWRDTNNTAAYSATPHTDYGPFRSIFDLMKVPTFQTVTTFWTGGSPGEVTNRFGDLSPFTPTFPALGAEKPTSPGEGDATDHVYGDVKSRFLALMRVSNLITTRSDSFTVYAQVQAWQNVGTPLPAMVATRRAAAIMDRSQVVPTRDTSTGTLVPAPMGVTPVPND